MNNSVRSTSVLRQSASLVGSDDDSAYFAAFDWVAEETGTYLLKVTSFEAVSTGPLVVTHG